MGSVRRRTDVVVGVHLGQRVEESLDLPLAPPLVRDPPLGGAGGRGGDQSLLSEGREVRTPPPPPAFESDPGAHLGRQGGDSETPLDLRGRGSQLGRSTRPMGPEPPPPLPVRRQHLGQEVLQAALGPGQGLRRLRAERGE